MLLLSLVQYSLQRNLLQNDTTVKYIMYMYCSVNCTCTSGLVGYVKLTLLNSIVLSSLSGTRPSSEDQSIGGTCVCVCMCVYGCVWVGVCMHLYA